jgi:hypothetical protein
VAEQNDRPLPRGLEPGQRHRPVRQLHGEDAPPICAASRDPAILARADPVNTRRALGSERVALLELNAPGLPPFLRSLVQGTPICDRRSEASVALTFQMRRAS